MRQAIKNAPTNPFRKKGEMLSQRRETRRAQRSNFDPAQKRTILMAKAQKPLQDEGAS
jgi:hypothetical protein